MKKFALLTWETLKTVIIALAIILPIRYFLVEPFYVKGASMEPNFHDHEYLIIDRLNYRMNEPQRGDVVVFRYPYNPQEYYIKRVIGLPGESVEVKDGAIYVYNSAHPEGFKLPEGYLPKGLESTPINPQFTRTDLKENQYYMMGDNRVASQDSRVFGPVDKSFLIGRVVFRGLPFDKIGQIQNPGY
ncbi:MAG: signal peptidase I [Candidatus Falkowbacteria bacterium]